MFQLQNRNQYKLNPPKVSFHKDFPLPSELFNLFIYNGGHFFFKRLILYLIFELEIKQMWVWSLT